MTRQPKDIFESDHYLRHNEKRQEHFRSMGISLAGMSVLELGAGIGNHTDFLLGFDPQRILAVEGRSENVEELQCRFDGDPRVSARLMDLENPGDIEEAFDACYCYGLLYHLANPDVLIEWMSRHTKKMLFLETCVGYLAPDTLNPVAEDPADVSQSISSTGSRPGRRWIYRQLEQHFPHVYVPVTQPDHEQFPTDWTMDEAPHRLTRAIFIASRQPLANEQLLDHLPDKQTTINT